jgi:hypothetical protein
VHGLPVPHDVRQFVKVIWYIDSFPDKSCLGSL